VGKEGTRNLPSIHQRTGTVTAQGCLKWKFPNVICIDGVTHIVVGRTISVAQVVWVLGALSIQSKAGKTAVGQLIECVAVRVGLLEADPGSNGSCDV
jgi:predicted Kef-type K+ transport protein